MDPAPRSKKMGIRVMRVLVTGATGLVGNNVVRRLLAQGHDVRVLARMPADSKSLQGLPIEWACGDVRDADAVRQAVAGTQAVIHAAGVVHIGWTRQDEHQQINVEGARHVAAAARAAAARLIHVSTVNTLGTAGKRTPLDEQAAQHPAVLCPYVVTKRAAEAVVWQEVEQGLDAVMIYPGFMLGPWDWKPSSGRMLLRVARRGASLAPWGGCSVCDVRDVAAGIVAALEQAPAASRYIMAGVNMTYVQLWRHFAALTGRRGPIMASGPLIPTTIGYGGDLWRLLTGRESDLNSAAVAMAHKFHYYLSDKANRELGYTNRPVVETIRDAWDWLRDQHPSLLDG